MDYETKNSKQVYIRLNENRQPVTCSEVSKGLFESSKVKSKRKFIFRVTEEVKPDALQAM